MSRSNNHFIWRWKDKELIETITMIVHQDVTYDNSLKEIIIKCELGCELSDIVITYIHTCSEEKSAAIFRIKKSS